MRLIDVDVVLSPKMWDGNIPNDAPKEVEEYIKGLYERIKNLPTVDIVYCKDCKYWDDDIDGYCILKDSFNWNADDFCSVGEKKDERA